MPALELQLLELMNQHGEPISPTRLAQLAQQPFAIVWDEIKKLIKSGQIVHTNLPGKYGDFYYINKTFTAPPQAELKL